MEERFIVWGEIHEPENPDSPPWEVVDLNPAGEPDTVGWFESEAAAQAYCDEQNAAQKQEG
jgi:hypothetical protein